MPHIISTIKTESHGSVADMPRSRASIFIANRFLSSKLVPLKETFINSPRFIYIRHALYLHVELQDKSHKIVLEGNRMRSSFVGVRLRTSAGNVCIIASSIPEFWDRRHDEVIDWCILYLYSIGHLYLYSFGPRVWTKGGRWCFGITIYRLINEKRSNVLPNVHSHRALK